METAENVTDIQNYLNNFQRDLQTGSGEHAAAAAAAAAVGATGDAGIGEVGQVYVDQSGQYFIRSTPDQTQPISTRTRRSRAALSAASTAVEGVGGIQQLTQVDVATTSAAGAVQASNFPTVTIVPTENSDEVSYVLIVQPDAEEGQKIETDEQNMAVYDFNEADEQREEVVESEEDDKRRLNIRGGGAGGGGSGGSTAAVAGRRSQAVAQAYMCNYCNYTSPKRYLLSRHMKSHSDERPHKCSVCERGFKTLASLQNHVNTHTGTKPHCCRFCDANFTTSGELVRHVRYIHTKEKPHQCTECDYSSVELSKLRRHMRSHTGERPYQCPHCTYASPDTFKLKRHLRIHTGEKPYECDICGSRFTQSNSLKAHKTIHSAHIGGSAAGAKPIYQCELCPTTCGRKTDLRIHVQKLHTSDKPIKCKRCGKSFPDRYSYKLHSKTHEGEKCFKCDLCPYSSINQRHLESHMLIHTDQKPYVCQHCNQSFRQKQLLKRHINLYHNPQYIPPQPREKTHECCECGRTFRHKGNLIRHLAIHDPEASAAEKQLALKLGRERKIQLMEDGEMYSDEEMSEDMEPQHQVHHVVDPSVLQPQQQQMIGEDDEAQQQQLEGGGAGGQRMVAVQGQDGQQYVVLEVIQLQDANGEAQTVAVVPDSALDQSAGVTINAPLSGTADVSLSTGVSDITSVTDQSLLTATSQSVMSDCHHHHQSAGVSSVNTRSSRRASTVATDTALKTRQDMQNCFGFDDDDDVSYTEHDTKPATGVALF